MRQVLDHVAVVVPDLTRAHATYRRLGFNLTPRSSHKGALQPGGPVEVWGAGNHCAMFERGYYEILGITDPDRHHAHVDARLASYHGLHLIALGCDDADAMHAHLRAGGLAVEPVVRVGRDVPFGAGTRPGVFEILRLPDGWFPEADLFYISHPTRDVLWQPGLLAQPNGVTALAAVSVCSADPDDTAGRLATLTGREAARTPGGRVVELDQGRVVVCTPGQLQASYPGARAPSLPSVAAVEFTVRDCAATAALLDANAVRYSRAAHGGLLVAADEGEGAWIRFSQP